VAATTRTSRDRTLAQDTLRHDTPPHRTLPHRTLRAGLAALLLATVAVSAAACSSSGTSLDDMGKLRNIDGGTAMTIPALWAGTSSDGTEVGGIEAAVVKVLAHKDGVNPVDLISIDSAGAGPQWRAATVQAAAVATLLSARNPQDIDLGFTVTGPIDGPSAGGILTVGILANLTQTPLLRGITMTGTISPDGSIGEVGGVPTKLAAAAAAGYTTAVVPEGSFLGMDEKTGTQFTVADVKKSLGITVVPVRTVFEAFTTLTGEVYAATPPVPVEPSASSEAAIESTTRAMASRLALAVASAPAGTDSDTLQLATTSVATMQTQIALDEWARAYGVGAFAYLRLARASGASEAQSWVDAQGIDAAKTRLQAEVQAALAEATTARDSAVANVGSQLEDVIYLPGALGWATYAIASYQGVLDDLAVSSSADAIVRAGRILSEERVGVREMLPDALTVLSGMPSHTPVPSEKVRTFMAGYADLLERAGDANVDYYVTLAGNDLRADGTFADDAMTASIAQLKKNIAAAPEPTTMDETLTATATALTYYVMSTGYLAGAQSYGLELRDADLRASAFSQMMDKAVDSGAVTVEAFADRLRADDLTVGYPLWCSRWGTAGAIEYRGTPQAGNAAWVGLNETWYDAVSLFMLTAISSETSGDATNTG
jgi:hypothetical protein